MRRGKRITERMLRERERLLGTYRMVLRSLHEARSLQSVMEKERQMRRLISLINRTAA